MALKHYGPYLNDEDIASMLNFDVLDQKDDQALHPAPPPRPTLSKCPICLNPISRQELFIPGLCHHCFCKACFRDFLTSIARETRKFPIPCPTCATPANPQRCLQLVQDLPHVYTPLSALILENEHIDHIAYCANPVCSAPFDFELPSVAQGQDYAYRVQCPVCTAETCVRCKCLWHKDLTCAQHAANESQTGLQRLATQKQWRNCPSCGNMIERRLGDCYFVMCRCGTGFCHRCGTPYKDLKTRPENFHGTPGCNCGLFEPNGAAQQRAPPVAPPPVWFARDAARFQPPQVDMNGNAYMQGPGVAHAQRNVNKDDGDEDEDCGCCVLLWSIR